MTAKCALVMALLEGRVLNVKNCFKEIGYTNIAREIPRLIEKPFNVQVSRTPREGKNRYKQSVTWIDYRLNRSEYNTNGIVEMERYVSEHQPEIQLQTKQKTALQTNKLF
jgi:hypothetical protein